MHFPGAQLASFSVPAIIQERFVRKDFPVIPTEERIKLSSARRKDRREGRGRAVARVRVLGRDRANGGNAERGWGTNSTLLGCGIPADAHVARLAREMSSLAV